jgi:hypothetical protein
MFAVAPSQGNANTTYTVVTYTISTGASLAAAALGTKCPLPASNFCLVEFLKQGDILVRPPCAVNLPVTRLCNNNNAVAASDSVAPCDACLPFDSRKVCPP